MQLIDIFSKAVEIDDPDERMAFVENHCKDDSSLRGQLIKMLEQYYDPKTFMKEPAIEAMPGASADGNETQLIPSEKPGDSIGPYKLLERIGEGGMGIIYMAEQRDQLVRRVALKIIKHGMDTKQVVARFEAERQALAMMEHPHIAKVLDAGATESGRPFFVMELVRGIPITEYCDTHRFTTEQRLQLFLSVCQAIQHAHQKGIIHRDIKPSNILVTLSDEKAHPVVIDFGIAKATHQRLTEKTLFTNFGLAIGTPAYMSPEQAQMSKLDVDTRSDVYSLGVLLYELLTGTTPIEQKELMSRGYGEMQRMIAEHEPPKPSLRISTLGIEDKKTTAQRRRVNDASLGHRIQGDLDWIVMKSLEKDRSRRYETVSGFASDIRRHLNDEPVSAVAPTFGYQLRKLYQRHRRQMKWIGVTACFITTFSVVSTTLAILLKQQNNLSDQRLFDSLVSQADALQKAGGVGYHTNGLDIVSQAVELKNRTMNDSDKRSLRDIAMATIGDPSIRTRISKTHPIHAPDSVSRTAVSGGNYAFGYSEGFVRIHDLFTGNLTGVLTNGHQAAIHSITPSMDGGSWATTDKANTVAAWKKEPNSTVWLLWDQISELHFESPPLVLQCGDGFLLFAEGTKDARLWKPGTDETPERIELPFNLMKRPTDILPHNIQVLAISPNGEILAIPDFSDGSVTVFDINSRKTLEKIKDSTPKRGFTTSFGPKGDVLCLGWSTKIAVYETKTWSRLTSTSVNTQGKGWNFGIAPHRPWLIYGGTRKTIWNYKSGQIMNVIENLPSFPTFGPNGTDQYFVTLLPRNDDTWTADKITAPQNSPALSIHLPSDSLTDIAFSPNGRWLATSSLQGVWVTDIETRTSFHLDQPQEIERGHCPSFSHDSTLLACSFGHPQKLLAWETETWKQVKTTGASDLIKIAFHPNSEMLAAGSHDDLTIYSYTKIDRESEYGIEFKRIVRKNAKGPVRHVVFSHDGKFVGWNETTHNSQMHSDLSVAELNIDGLQPVFQLEDVSTLGIDFLPNSNGLIANRYDDMDTSQWIPEHWNFLSETNKPAHRYDTTAYGISVAPRSNLFAGELSSEGIILFDWQTRKTIGRIALSKNDPGMIKWAPDGKHLAVLFNEGEIQIWDIEKMRRRLEELDLNW